MKSKTNIIRFVTVGFVMIGLMSSCSVHIARSIQKQYPALNSSTKVEIIQLDENIPSQYEELGTVTLGDAGATSKSKCTYEALLNLAIGEAKKIGGNAIKITESIPAGWQKGGAGTPQHGATVGIGARVAYQQCHTLSVLILKTNKDVD